MAYLTEASVIQKVGGEQTYLELVDAPTLSAVESDLKVLYLGQVDALFDGYARSAGYTVPLINTVDIAAIQSPLLAIANYILRKRGNREPSDADTEEYNDAIAWLKGVQAGTWQLPSGTGDEESVSDAEIDSYCQLFSRSTLRVL